MSCRRDIFSPLVCREMRPKAFLGSFLELFGSRVSTNSKIWWIIAVKSSKNVKNSLGLRKHSKSTPLLRAVSIQKPSKLYEVPSLDLLRSHLSNGAKGRNFYSHLLNYCTRNEGSLNPGNNCNLVTRCKQICSKNGISLYRYVLDDDYRLQYKRQLKPYSDLDGVADSLQFLLRNFTPENKWTAQMLLSPF